MTHSLRLLLSTPHPCSYISEQQASDLFIDPNAPIDSHIYSQLAQQGFRRSGSHIYRPHCQTCNACRSVRIPVSHFTPSRQQRRTWNKNRDLTITATSTPDRQSHLRLFKHYVKSRHSGGGMDEFEGEGPFGFFQSPWSNTLFYEFRDQHNTLIAVAVCDQLSDGLSAVYSYFSPNESTRSLGVFAVLWQIEQAKKRKSPYLYLGYWIAECRKMSYKNNYQPLEVLNDEKWENMK